MCIRESGTGRYGVRVAGPSPFTGDVLVESTGAITVEGANSYGLAVETGLNGKLQSLGTIRATGDNAAAIRTTGPITGNVDLAGTISALGANASGVSIEGDVGGALKIHSSVVATGYRYTTPPPARNFALISAIPASAAAKLPPASFWAWASRRMSWLIFIEQNLGPHMEQKWAVLAPSAGKVWS